MDISTAMTPQRAYGTATVGTLTGWSDIDTQGVGPVFTGCDVHAFVLPTYKQHKGVYATPHILEADWSGELSVQQREQLLGSETISNLVGVSYSTHRDKAPILSLGRINPSGFVGSHRTIAGSLVFYMEDASPISKLLTPRAQAELFYADELPPFDLYMTFVNDEGAWASGVIQGITLLDEGTVIEVDSPSGGIVSSYSYMALGMIPVQPGYFSLLPKPERISLANAVQNYSVSFKVQRRPLEEEPDVAESIRQVRAIMDRFPKLGRK